MLITVERHYELPLFALSRSDAGVTILPGSGDSVRQVS